MVEFSLGQQPLNAHEQATLDRRIATFEEYRRLHAPISSLFADNIAQDIQRSGTFTPVRRDYLLQELAPFVTPPIQEASNTPPSEAPQPVLSRVA